MAATYTQIKLAEMRECLDAGKGWRVDDTQAEYVFYFDIPSTSGMRIKVYTSIRTRSAEGRGVGQDAIRTVAIFRNPHTGGVIPVYKGRRVHRTQNWRANLKRRVIEVIETAKERHDWAIKKTASPSPAVSGK
jgi:hypothetical protein